MADGQQILPVKIYSATDIPLNIDGSGNLVVSLDISALATLARQDIGNASLASIDAKLPVSGMATSAKQDTGNTSLSSIDGKIPALGQAVAGGSVPVVLTSAQLSTLTPLATVAVTGTFWQATQPVSGTFFQATQPVSAASLPLPSGASTSALQTTGNTSLANLDVLLSTRLKPADVLTGVTTVSTVTSLTQMNGVAISMGTGVRDSGTQRVTIATNDSVPVIGTFFQATQPVSLASAPTTPVTGTFWQATQPVSATDLDIRNLVFATDKIDISGSTSVGVTGTFFQATQPVSVAATVPVQDVRASTGANASVADSASSVTILASNANRLGATVYNDSSATLFLLLGSTVASATNYTCKVVANGYYEVPFGYTGQLTGIWASDPGDGAARVTELVA